MSMVTKPPRSPNFLLIVTAMLGKGMSGVRMIRPEPTKHSFYRAVNHLKQMEKEAEAKALHDHICRQWPRRPSKVKPQVGDVRMYKNATQDDSVIARVPTEPMGGTKGSFTRARFAKCKDIYGSPRGCHNCDDPNKACMTILEPLVEEAMRHQGKVKRRRRRPT